MADINRMEQALVAADAAGDTEAARQLAAAIRAERSRVVQPTAPAPQRNSMLQNITGEAMGGLADMDNLLRTPAPLGALIQTAMGIKGPPLQGDPEFHNSAIGRGVRFAAPAVFPVGAQTKVGALAQSVANTGAGFLSGVLDKKAEDAGLPWYARVPLALSPAIGLAGTQAALKTGIRGLPSSADEMAANIKNLEEMGVTDFSASQVGPQGNSRLPLLERASSFVFGGQGPFQELGKKQSAQLKAQAEKIAGGSADDAEAAGQAVWNGLYAEGSGWVSRAKASEKALWGPVDAALEKATTTANTPASAGKWVDINQAAPVGVAPASTAVVKEIQTPAIQKALEDIVQSYDNPAMASALGGDKVGATSLLDAIKQAGGRMTYSDFKSLRNELGELQSGSLLAPSERGISSRQAARLWKAMLDDYGALAEQQGVGRELIAAREFSKNYHHTSRNFFKTIFGKEAEPTKIIDEITSGKYQHPAKIRALRDGLGPQEFGKLQEYVINRLGTPQGGRTGTFSLETFHTNYNNSFAGAGKSGEAVATAMFGAKGTATRDALETMFKFAEKTKEGSALLFNTSGTSGSGIAGASLQAILGDLAKKGGLMATGAAGAAAAGTGGIGIAGGIAGGAVLGNASARLFTSPKFARWLSKTAFQSNARLPGAISVIAATKLESDELEQAKQDFLAAYQARFGK